MCSALWSSIEEVGVVGTGWVAEAVVVLAGRDLKRLGPREPHGPQQKM